MNKQVVLYFLVLVTAVVSTASYGWNTFGPDERRPIYTTANPFNTIGKLKTDKGDCTATLVGRNLILTAAHCLNNSDGTVAAARFYPNYMEGRSAMSSACYQTWRGTSDVQGTGENDWAICQLYDNLGDIYGWMGYKSGEYTSVAMAGYSADFGGETGHAQFGCTIRNRWDNGLFTHDCDTTSGASGGPVFVFGNTAADATVGYIVGIHTGANHAGSEIGVHLDEFHPDYANYGVATKNFAATLKSLKGE